MGVLYRVVREGHSDEVTLNRYLNAVRAEAVCYLKTKYSRQENSILKGPEMVCVSQNSCVET